MAWFRRWFGLLVIALRALMGAAGANDGGGGGVETFFIEATSGEGSTSSNIQVGYRFTANADFDLKGLRARVGSSGVGLTLRLWRVSDTTLLDSVTVVAAGSSTWVQADFASPVALANGSDYVITLRRTDGGSTSLRTDDVADITFNSIITFVETRYSSDNNYPTLTLSNVRGFVDGVYVS